MDAIASCRFLASNVVWPADKFFIPHGGLLRFLHNNLRFKVFLVMSALFTDAADVFVCIDTCYTQKRNSGEVDLPKTHPATHFVSEGLSTEMEDYMDRVHTTKPSTKRAQKAMLVDVKDARDNTYEHPMLLLPPSVLNRCESSFKAANASSQFYDDTVLMALLCCRDCVLWLMNMHSAGKKQFNVYLLLEMLFQHLLRNITVSLLYDITCKPEQSACKWGFLDQYIDHLVFVVAAAALDVIEDHKSPDKIIHRKVALTAAQATLEKVKECLQRQELRLSIDDKVALHKICKNKYIELQINALALKRRLRDPLCFRHVQIVCLAVRRLRNCAEQKLLAHTNSAVKQQEPQISHLKNNYNKLCDAIVIEIQERCAPLGAVAPECIDTKALYMLDIDDAIWQDVWLQDEGQKEPLLWLSSDTMCSGIRAMLEVNCAQEEDGFLARACESLRIWFVEEWMIVNAAMEAAEGDMEDEEEDFETLDTLDTANVPREAYGSGGSDSDNDSD
ncbi:hypothetical protein B0H17DRAFT_1207891 [Mycena rosella]|uniref:Uncharacterized protein n=1 Tax=Mycena rosella TaxID=1033263 RepID=A0AAD7GA47_MYCRO|nr:hypothetical protein B0H17DRAFT_1207891 [Mycena rosella]